MTTCYQALPSFNIPGYSGNRTNSRCYDYVRENEATEFPIQVSSYAFQSRFPPISQLQADSIQKRKLPGNMSHLWSYGTPFLLKLLFSGNLPKAFYDEICRQNLPNKRNFKHLSEQCEKGNEKVELWEPKDATRIRELGRRVEQRIIEARLRQKETSKNLWEQKSEERRKRTEAVLLRKAGFMESGKRAYIEKIEKQSKKYKPRKVRKRNQDKVPETNAPSPINGVFVLTETK